MSFFLKIAIKSFSIILNASKIFDKSLFFLKFSSFLIDICALSRLSIKVKDSLANANPPKSNASSFSFSNLLL